MSIQENKEAPKVEQAPILGFNKDAQDRLDSAISKLIVFKPIFGTVFMFLNKRQVRDLPTMGVGILKQVDLGLFYNPEWIMTLTSGELRAVLQHEALHVLLHHITRADHFDYNKRGYNIAADMAINCHVANLPQGCFYPSTFQMPDFEAAEWYYESLKKEAEKNGQDVDQHTEGKGELVDSHGRWGECESDVVKEKIRGIAEKCIKAQEEKGWSDVGTGLAKAIIEANKPVVNWKRELRWFINKVILSGRRNTRTRINRREQAIRNSRPDELKNVYVQPGHRRNYTNKLLVGIDTSGSITDHEIQTFLSEINGMVAEKVECHVVMFDTQLLGEPDEIKKKIKSIQIVGRGGTNFTPILQYVDEHSYDGVVVFTDGCAPFDYRPKSRVLWALSPQGASVYPPFGKRVVVEIKKQ
jgi:predicted metal-dependent peptidase